jgi:uncharacterized protein
MTTLEVRTVSALSAVSPQAWDALVGPEDPFTEHAFLSLLETSESVGPRRTGWVPCHVLVHKAEQLVGAMPLYIKSHSYGEFIFDFGWAQAAMRAGLPYYPKLVSAVPLTPATGARLLIAQDVPRVQVMQALIQGAREVLRTCRGSSLHVLFCTEAESQSLAALGLHARTSYQYHWQNLGFATFADFLGALRNASRKQVRKERERAQASGLTLSMRHASELDKPDWDAMWEFYLSTIEDKGSTPYLTREFFAGLAQNSCAYASMAHDGREPVAGSLFFWKGHSLFGRYWGARRDIPMLHFELCYYLPMEWGLARGMQRFEAGAQGEHKIKRGFLPNVCHSAHLAAHPGLDQAIARFVDEESSAVQTDMRMLEGLTPFKREGHE